MNKQISFLIGPEAFDPKRIGEAPAGKAVRDYAKT